MAIVKLQAEEDLDFQEACMRAAVVLDEKSERYHEEVRKEAGRLYKKRFMGEQNKAKQTWIEVGRKQGLSMAEELYTIEYPCARCGKPMTLQPGGKVTSDVIDYLSSKGWGHSTCPN